MLMEAFSNVIGESLRMREIGARIAKLAPTNARVLIQGENGTGKELVARALHASGSRRDQPFVTLDCSTIAEGLIESHLFGHVRGAFTGAVSTREGVFARAHRGTLFIDEITELRLHLQSRLLRVIQTGEFTMVGRSRSEHVDIRIITATNRDLPRAVMRGEFREDLYYRIAVARIDLPPLRDRREDVPLLVAHFLERLAVRYPHRRIHGVTARAMRALVECPWPGNVRQLEHCLESAVVQAECGLLDLEHFPAQIQESPWASRNWLQPGLTLAELERQYLLETLERVDGNRTRAARLLGISPRGLHYKLRSYAPRRTPLNSLAPEGAGASEG
jgi:DNA-binding NtrC family response regulator